MGTYQGLREAEPAPSHPLGEGRRAPRGAQGPTHPERGAGQERGPWRWGPRGTSGTWGATHGATGSGEEVPGSVSQQEKFFLGPPTTQSGIHKSLRAKTAWQGLAGSRGWGKGARGVSPLGGVSSDLAPGQGLAGSGGLFKQELRETEATGRQTISERPGAGGHGSVVSLQADLWVQRLKGPGSQEWGHLMQRPESRGRGSISCRGQYGGAEGTLSSAHG